MSKYSDKKKRRLEAMLNGEEVEKEELPTTASEVYVPHAVSFDDAKPSSCDTFEVCQRKRIEKYNNRRAEARNARRNRRSGIREMTNPELIFLAREIEKQLKQAWKVAEVIGELRRRFTLSLGLSNELSAALSAHE